MPMISRLFSRLGLVCLLSSGAAACASEEDLGRRSDTDGGSSSKGDDSRDTVNSGGTSTAKLVCEGTPLSCEETPDKSECTKRGCSYAPPVCTGTAADCSTLSQATCDYVPGCQWALSFGVYKCTGRAVACDERALTGNCDAVLGKSGCRNVGGCSGTPKPCSDSTGYSTCAPGCTIGSR